MTRAESGRRLHSAADERGVVGVDVGGLRPFLNLYHSAKARLKC